MGWSEMRARRSGLARKRHTAEQIIGKLREAEVGLASGKRVAEVVRELTGLGSSSVVASDADGA